MTAIPSRQGNYDRPVRSIYHGAIEQPPWHGTLPALREAFDAQVASLVLRPVIR